MGWIIYSVFISFAAPVLMGFWLGNRSQLDFSGVIKGIVLGLILLVAVFYITELQIDLYMWKAYMSEKSASEALGQGWLTDPLWRALRTLIISYIFFLMAYGIRMFLRGRSANMTKAAEGAQ